MCAALLGLMLVCSTTIFPARGRRGTASRQQRAHDRPALEKEVQIARSLHADLAHARRKRDGAGELRGDRAGRLAKGLGEVECHGAGEIPERELGRPLENDALDLGAELAARRGAKGVGERGTNGLEHGRRV